MTWYNIGSDEVGYGSYAGPLLVVAVAAPIDWIPPTGLTDSKRLSEAKRERLAGMLSSDRQLEIYADWTYPGMIDKVGVYTKLVEGHCASIAWCSLVVRKFLHCGVNRRVADGSLPLPGIHSEPKAEVKYPCVAAASVIAKVRRDRFMKLLGKVYPAYGFEKHKGYGSKLHVEALKEHGVIDGVHRKSYKPIMELL